MKRALLALAALALLAAPAHAQLSGGNVYGVIQDESGAALSGVAVNLTGPGITQSFTVGSDGRFRFLNVPPGSYKITASLTGFSTVVRESVVLVVGATVEVPLTLKVAQVEETITVTAESPVIDTKKTGTATNFTQDELSKVPNSRDPWALLRTVPGVIMDRVNIAGNESGQQSIYVGKGTLRQDSVWSLDGVNITDMAALGASPTYFDYDAFEEIQIATGGNDIRQSTGGIALNFVTKRGTNNLHGTVRGYFTHDDLESSNVPDELKALGVTAETADHNRQIADYGADLGGPLVKDKLWFWGSYGKQDIRLVRSAGALIDKTLLKDYTVKVNWQATSKDMVNILWFRGAKQKFGRGTGVAQVEAPSATWNQDDNYPDDGPFGIGLPGLWKIEDNHVFNPNLFVAAKYAYYGTGFKLESVGPLTDRGGISALLGQSFGSTRSLFFLRPQHTANLDGSWFKNALGGNHEFKFGVGYRRTEGASQTLWPADKVVAYDNSTTDKRARLYREGNGNNLAEYWSAYIGDTFTKDRLTLNVGVRWDRQTGEALPAQAGPNDAFKDLVPGINFGGYKAPFTWNDFSPRVGLTYALDESRKTLVRAGFARYASQLATGDVGYANPSASVGFADYRWTDLNGDHFAQPGEVNIGAGVISFGGGFNPSAPTAVRSANIIDPNLRAPLSQEIVVGIDRELVPNLAVSVSYTYRKNTDGLIEPRPQMTAADYTPGTVVTGTLPGGQPYSIQTFQPIPAKVTAGGSGRILTNADSYSQRYNGLELAVVKRLSNKWMMRVAASWMDHTEGFDSGLEPFNGNPTRLDTDPLVEGGQVAPRSAGSGSGDVFVNGKWALNINAMYQLPWDMEIAGNLFGRHGNAFPLFRQVALGLDGSLRVLVTSEVDSLRFEDIWNLDLRLAKNVRSGRTNLVLTADLFNALNSNVELNRQRNIGSAAFNRLTQNLSPRIVRFGVRLGF